MVSEFEGENEKIRGFREKGEQRNGECKRDEEEEGAMVISDSTFAYYLIFFVIYEFSVSFSVFNFVTERDLFLHKLKSITLHTSLCFRIF